MKEITFDNINNNDKTLDNIKKEAEKVLYQFSLEIDKNMQKIAGFDKNNYDELIKLIFDNLADLSDYEASITFLENKLLEFEDNKERLKYHKTMTKKDIFDRSIFKLYGLYNINIIVSWLTASSISEFIHKFIAFSLLEFCPFMMNMTYFTSEKYRNRVDLQLSNIDKYIEINKYDIASFYKFREKYIEELTFEVTKLYEIMELYNPNHKKNYKRMCELLRDLKIDFILNDSQVKTKIKKNNI